MERFAQFIGILTREKGCCEALLEQSRKKKESLIKNDVAAIEAITPVELDLIQSMTDVEQERLAQTRRIAENLGIPAEELTIQKMIELSDEAEAARLTQLWVEFGGILEEQLRLNMLNNSMIEAQLNYIDYMFNVTTTPSTLTNSYTASGSAPVDSRLKFIDHQI